MARVAVIAGDGIGRDVVAEVLPVLRALGGLALEELPWGAEYFLETGITVPSGGYDALREFDAVFIGALGDPRIPDNRHARDILLGTRFELAH
jgi:3-isopropylmalate dehydrogenase